MASGFGIHGGPGRWVQVPPCAEVAGVGTGGVGFRTAVGVEQASCSPLPCACIPRCYPIWMDFSECMSKTEDPKKCADFRDDYLECLHHRKEVRPTAAACQRWSDAVRFAHFGRHFQPRLP